MMPVVKMETDADFSNGHLIGANGSGLNGNRDLLTVKVELEDEDDCLDQQPMMNNVSGISKNEATKSSLENTAKRKASHEMTIPQTEAESKRPKKQKANSDVKEDQLKMSEEGLNCSLETDQEVSLSEEQIEDRKRELLAVIDRATEEIHRLNGLQMKLASMKMRKLLLGTSNKSRGADRGSQKGKERNNHEEIDHSMMETSEGTSRGHPETNASTSVNDELTNEDSVTEAGASSQVTSCPVTETEKLAESSELGVTGGNEKPETIATMSGGDKLTNEHSVKANLQEIAHPVTEMLAESLELEASECSLEPGISAAASVGDIMPDEHSVSMATRSHEIDTSTSETSTETSELDITRTSTGKRWTNHKTTTKTRKRSQRRTGTLVETSEPQTVAATTSPDELPNGVGGAVSATDSMGMDQPVPDTSAASSEQGMTARTRITDGPTDGQAENTGAAIPRDSVHSMRKTVATRSRPTTSGSTSATKGPSSHSLTRASAGTSDPETSSSCSPVSPGSNVEADGDTDAGEQESPVSPTDDVIIINRRPTGSESNVAENPNICSPMRNCSVPQANTANLPRSNLVSAPRNRHVRISTHAGGNGISFRHRSPATANGYPMNRGPRPPQQLHTYGPPTPNRYQGDWSVAGSSSRQGSDLGMIKEILAQVQRNSNFLYSLQEKMPWMNNHTPSFTQLNGNGDQNRSTQQVPPQPVSKIPESAKRAAAHQEPQKAVRTLALAAFGVETLKASSITGRSKRGPTKILDVGITREIEGLWSLE